MDLTHLIDRDFLIERNRGNRANEANMPFGKDYVAALARYAAISPLNRSVLFASPRSRFFFHKLNLPIMNNH